jgi:hypothetical protein
MENLLVAKAKLLFKLEGEFEWSGWNGEAELETSDNSLKIDGATVATTSDLKNWIGRVLGGKQYKGLKGLIFDAPGTVEKGVSVSIEGESEAVVVGDMPALTRRTSGRFEITVDPKNPATNTKPTPPVQDTELEKKGKWTVIDPGQTIAESI